MKVDKTDGPYHLNFLYNEHRHAVSLSLFFFFPYFANKESQHGWLSLKKALGKKKYWKHEKGPSRNYIPGLQIERKKMCMVYLKQNFNLFLAIFRKYKPAAETVNLQLNFVCFV